MLRLPGELCVMKDHTQQYALIEKHTDLSVGGKEVPHNGVHPIYNCKDLFALDLSQRDLVSCPGS